MSKIAKAFKSVFQSATSSLDDIRAQVAAVQAEIDAVSAAPLDKASAAERVRQWVAKQNDRVPMHDFLNPEDPNPAPSIYPDDTNPMTLIFKLAGKSAVEAHMLAQIDAEYELHDVAPMSAADRAQKLGALRARKLELERAEELAVTDMEASGLQVLRRPDADPRAVLGIAD